MEICELKLNDSEYLLRKDEWIRRFEVSETNRVTAYHNVVFEKVDGRTIGFKNNSIVFYLADEKLNQLIFRTGSEGESQIFEEIKSWLNEHTQKHYEFLIQLH